MTMTTDEDIADSAEVDTPTPTLSREEYFAERRLLIDARQRGYQRADQMVTGGATGALLLSVTFLEKLVPAATAIHVGTLLSAWGLLLLCLSLRLFGQYCSANAFGCEIERLEAALHSEPLKANRWSTYNTLSGVISAVLFVVGIALLARFAYVNAPFQRG